MSQAADRRLPNRFEAVAVGLVFIAILAIGLTVFDDYGVAYDDPVERDTTLANLKYIVMTFAPSMELPDALANAPDLIEWRDRHYGVAAQIPSALAEWITGFDWYSSRIYKVRHLWVFIQFYIALVLFYYLLKRRFGSIVLALAGFVTLFLTPRIFADAFYNVKDSVFLSWGIVSFYALFRWIEKPTRANLVLFGAVSAVLINTRVIGALLPAAGMAILCLFWRRGALSAREWAYQGLLLFVSTAAIWIIVTPYAWHNPPRVLFETAERFSAFPIRSMELYRGELIANDALPWHYLPVWIAISMPMVTLIGCLGGVALFLAGVQWRWKAKNEWRWVCADGALLIWGVVPILIAILLGSTLYDGWRHFYFIVPTLVYFTVFSLDRIRLSRFVTVRGTAYILLAISMIYQGVWIIRNHPYEMVYFNELIPLEMRMSFEKDYWNVTSAPLIRFILDSSDAPRIRVASSGIHFPAILSNFSDEESGRIDAVWSMRDLTGVEFIIVSYSNIPVLPLDISGYQPTFEIVGNSLPLSGVYERVDNIK